MIIHVVQPGETLESIALNYQISQKLLIEGNGITNPDNLVVGQTIVILYPLITYTVVAGDTLSSIADLYGISVMQILRNNFNLSLDKPLIPGDIIIISYDTTKVRTLDIAGYAYPFIDETILKKTLPYLTYLTVFNYTIVGGGDLVEIDDERVIELAKSYGVAPLMMISTLTEKGVGSRDIADEILTNMEIQDAFIEKVVRIMKEKGYYGLNSYSQFLSPETQLLYEAYLGKLSKRVHEEGYRFVITISPRTNYESSEIEFERTDYSRISQMVDAIGYLSYQWGYSIGPPASVTPVNILREIVNYLVTVIPNDKLYLGLPVIGYDWQLPYIPGSSRANALTTESAIEIAALYNVPIEYSEVSAAPYFFYINEEMDMHIVWFKDARSIDTLVQLVPEYGLAGLSIWNVMSFFTQMWFVINAKYEITKVLKTDL